jgi:hypothetical protein
MHAKTIVILEHALQQGLGVPYMLYAIAERWKRAGHTVLIHYGPGDPPPGDLAILNMDMTVVPQAYHALLDRYPRVLNRGTLDISKRTFSRHLVQRGDDQAGPVIVKTDANFQGKAEHLLRSRARQQGIACDIATGPVLSDYPIYRSVREVPARLWEEPGLIVERFLPEHDARGFYSRHWIFLGDRGRSVRYRADVPVIKSHHMLDRETVALPDEIRAWRDRLGFDYGKFDYVRSAEGYVLLDVNRTPALPMQGGKDIDEALDLLATGIRAYL